MPQWTLSDSGLIETGGVNTSLSIPTTVTASTPHTKGGWTELIAATSVDATGFWLTLRTPISTSTTDPSMLLDLGTVRLGDRDRVEHRGRASHRPARHLAGLFVPSGTRVSARCQAKQASDTIEVTVHAYGGGWNAWGVGTLATTYGADTATSSGTALSTPGATHTKGRWHTIASSTTNPIHWLIPCVVGPPGDTDWSGTNTGCLIDIGSARPGLNTFLSRTWLRRWRRLSRCTSRASRFPRACLRARSWWRATRRVPCPRCPTSW